MYKVLTIEDEEGVRSNIQEILELSGFDPIVACNGEEGIELACKYQPHLIICDLMMPKLDGYDVLKRLRKEEKMATTPFIFLTAKADRAALRQGMELGADDYLTKPFTPDELLKAINIRLAKQEFQVEKIRKSSLYEVECLRKKLMTQWQQLNRTWHRAQRGIISLNGEIGRVQRDRRNISLLLYLASSFAGISFFSVWFLFLSDRWSNSSPHYLLIPYIATEQHCLQENERVWEHNACWELENPAHF
ncbi:MAG: response regulator [Cyanobacteria bacterium SBLK]|nr:response regulator [Cyanobacteria bacterium SBLK]